MSDPEKGTAPGPLVQPSADSDSTPHKLPVKTLIAASIGNAIEWYDWTVYATFLIYFATQFFPADNPGLALVNTTATYAVAFFSGRSVDGCLAGSPMSGDARPP